MFRFIKNVCCCNFIFSCDALKCFSMNNHECKVRPGIIRIPGMVRPEVFVTINKDGMKINADANAKKWLAKKYVIKDLIWIIAVVNVNPINHVMLENICKCRKRLVDKLVEECSENIDHKKTTFKWNDQFNLKWMWKCM